MTEPTKTEHSSPATRQCSRPGCNERFSLIVRGGRNSDKATPGSKRTYHKGRRYCSDTCRKLASKARLQPSPVIALSTPEQKCISWPEQKYISDAGNKAPELGPFLEALSLGGIVHRRFRAGTA
jgi:hypothetical protein